MAIEDTHPAMTSDETSLEDRRDIRTTSVNELEGGLKTAEIKHRHTYAGREDFVASRRDGFNGYKIYYI